MQKPFYILSIDGGGMRGVFPARLLQCMEEKLGINIYQRFDLLAGTSTGSIIAAGLAHGIKAARIVDMYEKHGKDIFASRFNLPKPINLAASLLFSHYDNHNLADVLARVLGDIRLGQIAKLLLIPVTDIARSRMRIFRSQANSPDADVPLRQAVLASCSAPIYFDPVQINESLLADGGLWANNPALAAVIDAKKRLNAENIRVLSLGTGHFRLGQKTGPSWGVLTQWGGLKMMDLITSVQSQSIHNHLELFLAPEQVLRLNFHPNEELPIDDYTNFERLLAYGDKVFSQQAGDIEKFITDEVAP